MRAKSLAEAEGTKRNNGKQRRIAVIFDAAEFLHIKQIALDRKHSLSKTIRVLALNGLRRTG